MDNRSIYAGYMTPEGLLERTERVMCEEMARGLNFTFAALAKPALAQLSEAADETIQNRTVPDALHRKVCENE